MNLALKFVRKHWGKRKKCLVPAFSPFPTIFQTPSFSGQYQKWGPYRKRRAKQGDHLVRGSICSTVRRSKVPRPLFTYKRNQSDNLKPLFTIFKYQPLCKLSHSLLHPLGCVCSTRLLLTV